VQLFLQLSGMGERGAGPLTHCSQTNQSVDQLFRLLCSSLEWVIGEQGPSNPVVALVGRRLQVR